MGDAHGTGRRAECKVLMKRTYAEEMAQPKSVGLCQGLYVYGIFRHGDNLESMRLLSWPPLDKVLAIPVTFGSKLALTLTMISTLLFPCSVIVGITTKGGVIPSDDRYVMSVNSPSGGVNEISCTELCVRAGGALCGQGDGYGSGE